MYNRSGFPSDIVAYGSELGGLFILYFGGTEAVAVAGDPMLVWRYVDLMLAFGLEVVSAAAALSWGRGREDWAVQTAHPAES